jgi:type IV pilus assembly protein PilE
MTARAAGGRAMRGFSLMELMITLAIAAIIAAVAIPSYTAFVERGKRAAARSEPCWR